MNKKYDYIIIGQGLAGSALAWRLYFNNKSFIIIDSEANTSASKAALGIYNPITGRKNIKTWNADILFKELENFYMRVEKSLNTKILYRKNIFRPFKNNRYLNDWNIRLGNEKYKKYLKKINDKGITTKGSGYLDVKKYLKETKKYFKHIGRYKVHKLNNTELLKENNHINIDGYNFNKIVMCMGIDQKKINLFSEIKLIPVAGNSIKAESKFFSDNILNKRISIFNVSKNEIYAGSTYNNGNINKGINLLKNQINKIINSDFKILKSYFGIRPASKDRRPIVGKHKIINNLFIINGLGSKGVSQSPYCSKQLFDYIENNKKINIEINIDRIKA
jgi:glycine/D-amino acid oxidase-like deaminating enzyme